MRDINELADVAALLQRAEVTNCTTEGVSSVVLTLSVDGEYTPVRVYISLDAATTNRVVVKQKNAGEHETLWSGGR